jgi:hypothetical protein
MNIEQDPEARFRKHMPRSKDITLIVLKGHLLLEEQMDLLLDVYLENPKPFRRMRPTFSTRLAVLRSLIITHSSDRFLNAAEKLNVLRNKLAHHLEAPELERHIEMFLGILEGESDPPPPAHTVSPVKRLRVAIAFLCAVIAGYRDAATFIKADRKKRLRESLIQGASRRIEP